MADHKVIKLGSGGRLYRDARKRAPHDEAAHPVHDVPPPPPPSRSMPAPWAVNAVGKTEALPQQPVEERDWQQLRSTMVELAGVGFLTAGCSLLYLWLGLVVLGTCLIILGVASGLPELDRPA